MTKQIARAIVLVTVMAAPALAEDRGPSREPRAGQLGRIGGAVKRVQQFKELQITDAEEQRLGAGVSERIRVRYGVVQDAAVHRYVALVGGALAQASGKPDLPWTFIVLDTDAVNAFAAPGGFVHITRGALALIQDEAELAGVLAHELIHITEKHTVRALVKSKSIQMGADETLSGTAGLLNQLTERVYLDIVNNSFGRAEENESDEKGIAVANAVGYAQHALGAFLTRLQERNKDARERRGLFASHPEMKERLDRLSKQIQSQKLASTATLADRYRTFISYTPVSQSAMAVVESGAAGLAGSTDKPPAKAEEKKEEPPAKKRGFGLGRLLPTGGGEKKSAEVTASGGARGVDPERDAKGGANPKPVPVRIAAADLAGFKKEGSLK